MLGNFFRGRNKIALKDVTPEQLQEMPKDPRYLNQKEERKRAVEAMVNRRREEAKERAKAREVATRFKSVYVSSRRESTRARRTRFSLRSFATGLSLVDSEREITSANSEGGHERRVSRVMRHMKTNLRRQMDGLQSSIKVLMTAVLVITIVQGILQGGWHIQLANVLAVHTNLNRAYNLVTFPTIWYAILLVVSISSLCYVRHLDDQALLRGLRRLLGMQVDEDGNAEDEILDDFKVILDGLNEKLDLIGSQSQKVQNVVSSFSGFAENAKRLAERMLENRSDEFRDEAARQSLVLLKTP